MNKRSRILRFAFAGVLLPVLGLGACGSLRNAAGLEKTAPDEFAVLTKAPLIIPPDYNLRPPVSGAPPTNQKGPTDMAVSAMFGSADPQTVAAGMTGNYSPGEKLLLATAGVQNNDPGIRAELQSDEKSMMGADESFTDKVLNGPAPQAAAPADDKGKARTQGSATIEQKSGGGWFDWF